MDPIASLAPTVDWAKVDQNKALQHELTLRAIAWTLADRQCDDLSAALVRTRDEAAAHGDAVPDVQRSKCAGVQANFQRSCRRVEKCDDEFRQTARKLVDALESPLNPPLTWHPTSPLLISPDVDHAGHNCGTEPGGGRFEPDWGAGWAMANPPPVDPSTRATREARPLSTVIGDPPSGYRPPAQSADHGAVRDQRQADLFAWAKAAFTVEQTTSLPQRGLRLLEESVEAFQACGGDPAMGHRLVDYVFSRPVGDLRQELGGVSVGVLVLAAAAGLSADDAERTEANRVLSMSLEHFQKRNDAKNAAGFLAIAVDGSAPRTK